jgi:hypothetical protein
MDTAPVSLGPSPAPESANKPRFWGAWATIGLGLATGLVFFAAQTVVLLVYLVVKIASGPISDPVGYLQSLADNGLVISLSTVVSALAGIAFIVLFVRIRGNKSVSGYLGFGRISRSLVITAIIVFIIAFAAILGLGALYAFFAHTSSAESANSSFMTDTYQTAGWLPLLWVAVVLFAPVFEETFFRGFLFAGLERSRLGAVGTIIFTSLVWASLHLQYNFIGMATILILGLVLGTVRLKTRSVWPTVMIHALWNAAALAATAAALKG